MLICVVQFSINSFKSGTLNTGNTIKIISLYINNGIDDNSDSNNNNNNGFVMVNGMTNHIYVTILFIID